MTRRDNMFYNIEQIIVLNFETLNELIKNASKNPD
jgi:hypothetical protein